MPDQVTFAAQKRDVLGKAVKRLRREGFIPANIYGHDRPSVPVQVNAHDFELFLRRHAATTLLRLSLDGGGAPETALVRHIEREPVTGNIQHVDFLYVRLTEAIKARVPVRLEGEAPAVRIRDGILLQLLDAVEVEARPTDLPPALTLDVSGLAEVKATLYVRDIPLPPGVKPLTDPDEPVVKVEPARVITEAVPAPEAAPTAPAPAPEGAPAEEG
ncbi:MAG TPA: 50S ribosomal protein L25 [Ktedonobacterales bacterium]